MYTYDLSMAEVLLLQDDKEERGKHGSLGCWVGVTEEHERGIIY